MKVKVISRSTDDFTRERSKDLQKVFRNYDPALRSQEKAVEYTRALNAAKLEKIFARPFVGAMDGHIDAISCTAKNPNHLRGVFSGSRDGVNWREFSRRNLRQQHYALLGLPLWVPMRSWVIHTIATWMFLEGGCWLVQMPTIFDNREEGNTGADLEVTSLNPETSSLRVQW